MSLRPFAPSRFLARLLALAALLAAMGAAHASRLALVIGNARYADKPLSNPANDAEDVAREFQRLGFTVHKHVDLSRRDLNGALRKFMSAAQNAELAVVYYSGHGLQAGGENYLVPVDARISDERDIRSEGVALRDVMSDLDEAKARRVVVVLDACRDNPFATRARSVKRGLARPDVSANAAIVAFATAEGRTADDGNGRNGVYTTEFLQQLRRPQDVRDVFDETSLAVSRRSGDQRPKVYGDTGAFKNVYFSLAPATARQSPTAAPAARSVNPEDEAWEEIKTSNNVAALRAFLDQFPTSSYAGRVKMRLASLSPAPQAVSAATPAPAQSQAPTTAGRRSAWLDR